MAQPFHCVLQAVEPVAGADRQRQLQPAHNIVAGLTAKGCICTVKGASAAVGAGSTSVLRFLPLRLAGAGSGSVPSSDTTSLVLAGLPRFAEHLQFLWMTAACGSSSMGLLLPTAMPTLRDNNIVDLTLLMLFIRLRQALLADNSKLETVVCCRQQLEVHDRASPFFEAVQVTAINPFHPFKLGHDR